MIKSMTKLVIYGLLAIGLVACKKASNADVVAAAVAENVNSFRSNKLAECRMRVYEDASRVVDSLLLAEALQRIMTRTDVTVPARPNKPGRPEVRSPLDTVAVKPFFK